MNKEKLIIQDQIVIHIGKMLRLDFYAVLTLAYIKIVYGPQGEEKVRERIDFYDLNPFRNFDTRILHQIEIFLISDRRFKEFTKSNCIGNPYEYDGKLVSYISYLYKYLQSNPTSTSEEFLDHYIEKFKIDPQPERYEPIPEMPWNPERPIIDIIPPDYDEEEYIIGMENMKVEDLKDLQNLNIPLTYKGQFKVFLHRCIEILKKYW